MTGRVRAALLTLALLLAAVETVTATCVYRRTVDEEDWALARAALAAVPANEPVLVGTTWLGPRIRMEFPTLAALDHVGRPDLRGLRRFHVVGLDAWSPDLEHDLEGLPAPRAVETQDLDDLRLTTYENPTAGHLTADFTSSPDLKVSTGGSDCRRRGDLWRCEEGTVRVRLAEVDYRPRRCLVLDVADGTTVRFSVVGVTGDRLRGHLGIDDFNARLRSDAPVAVSITVDGEPAARLMMSDEEGWRPFSVSMAPGSHQIAVDVTVPVRGTWNRGHYQPGSPHAACLDLRVFQEGET